MLRPFWEQRYLPYALIFPFQLNPPASSDVIKRKQADSRLINLIGNGFRCKGFSLRKGMPTSSRMRDKLPLSLCRRPCFWLTQPAKDGSCRMCHFSNSFFRSYSLYPLKTNLPLFDHKQPSGLCSQRIQFPNVAVWRFVYKLTVVFSDVILNRARAGLIGLEEQRSVDILNL